MSKYLGFRLPNTQGLQIIKLMFAFLSISFLLFGSTIVITSYAQPQGVPSQGGELAPQLQQQQKQQPQLQQRLQQQDEQQELKYEQQRLQQKGLPATTAEQEEGKITKSTPRDFTYAEDGPQIEDLQRLQAQTPPGSPLRAKILGSTTVNLTSQSQTPIIAPPPNTILQAPPSPQPQPDTGALARGCKTGLYERVNPAWVGARPFPYGNMPSVAEGIITPSKVTVTHHDFPFNHKSHDQNFHVKVDPKYTGLASTAHPQDANGQRTMEMEWEIGSANTGITDRFPKEFWPWVGDRVWMIGRWVWDCGHFTATPTPHGYQTEIHPPFATAFTRDQPNTFPGENRPSSAKVTYIYVHGRGGYYDTPVGGRNYEFDIPTPPKPFLPGAQLRPHVIGLPFGGPAPIVTAKSQLCDFGGTMSPCAHVVIPLSGIPASPSLKYGAIVATKWINPITAFQPTEGFRTLRVTFDSIRVNEDHDYFSGEWDNLWVGVNGKWIELSGPSGRYGLNDVDNGELIRFPAGSKSVIVTVPEKGELKFQTSGWEDDNDGYYGRSLLSFPPPAGALNDNDKIGIVIKRDGFYTAANNFGIGPHSDFSESTGPSETNRDFTLNYRIEQLSITPPTTRPPAQLPTAPTQPPLLR